MLADIKFRTLQELIEGATKEELIWINGYLAGLVKQGSTVAGPAKTLHHKLTIVFGTDTGNSKRLASELAAKGKKAGMAVKLGSLEQYRLNDLSKEEYFLVVISTHGDGEPPAAAKKFYNYIHENTLKLDTLKYAVLALGDTAYPLFCKAGEDVDARLQVLGATRFHSIQKCDTDYETEAHAWFDSVLASFSSSVVGLPTPAVTTKSSGKKNFRGKVLTNVNLSGRGSAKRTHHIEIESEDVVYQPGDSLGIVPENPSEVVESVINLVDIGRDKIISYRQEEIAVYELLKKKLNIVYLADRVVNKYSSIVGQEIPPTHIDLLNLLKIYPVRDAAQFEEVIAILEPITPRLYSIASSPAAHAGEVHLTVARNCFTINDEVGYGLASDYLINLKEESYIDFYIHKNSQFRLPSPETDVIMIGPGTGIAPFRAFIEERDATGARGRNWLFFGDQHFESDFLYQTEIQSYLSTGVLTSVHVAFSRDQKDKIYVQNKILKHGAAFFGWIESGAHIYVCGSRDPMSQDVENALVQIIELFGNRTPVQAAEYLDRLKEEGRYQKDVY